MTTDRVETGGLKVASVLYDFVNNEAMAGTGIAPEDFWNSFGSIVQKLAPQNRQLRVRVPVAMPNSIPVLDPSLAKTNGSKDPLISQSKDPTKQIGTTTTRENPKPI